MTDLEQAYAPSSATLKKYARILDSADPKKVIPQLPYIHQQAFQKVDCLSCARCCKGYSPRFKSPDIVRLAKATGMKEQDFIDTYLMMDGDHDYVSKSQPCPFLNDDNACQVYNDRPSDCRRFPYTGEDVIVKRKKLTLMNATFCPAVGAAITAIEKLR